MTFPNQHKHHSQDERIKSSKIYLPIKEKEESFQPGCVSHLQSLLIKPFRGLIFLD